MIVAFYTLGCKVNQYDTQTMMTLFREKAYAISEFNEYADVYVINTCTVTAMSDKKSRQMIARATRRNPNAIVVVTGCYAQRDAEQILKLAGVRLVLGNQNRDQIVLLVERVLHDGISINAVEDIREVATFEDLPAMSDGRTRAHLKIQDGCNRYCSYCIIPYARGDVRSRSLKSIYEETKRFVDQGFVEFVLTGIHLSSYGVDFGLHLQDAIECVSSVSGVLRIRLGSLEPMILQEEFVQYCANNPKVCRQFHISMQSGSDIVLKSMNRRYTAEEYASYIACIREYMPDAAITTDVIAGFPGETDDLFQETLVFVQEIQFARLHVFPYSIREGTVAAQMPMQIEHQEKERRSKLLIAAGKTMMSNYMEKQKGQKATVLIEECENEISSGYTEHYIRVRLKGSFPVGTTRIVIYKEQVGEEMNCELAE